VRHAEASATKINAQKMSDAEMDKVTAGFVVTEIGNGTACSGQGVTVFFGMAKPVYAPQIGPARAP
jgi:hypothetical protein